MGKIDLKISDYVVYNNKTSQIVSEDDKFFHLKDKHSINKKTCKVKTQVATSKSSGLRSKTVYKWLSVSIEKVFTEAEFLTKENRRNLLNEISTKIYSKRDKLSWASDEVLTELNAILDKI